MLLHTIVEPLQIHLAKGCCTNLLVFVASMLCRYIDFVGQSHSAQKIHTAAQCQSMKNISRYLVFCSPLPCLRLQPSWKVCGSTGCVSSQALMLVDWHFRAKRHSLKTRTCFFLGWWFSSQTGYQLLKHVTRRVSYVGIGSMRSPAIAD